MSSSRDGVPAKSHWRTPAASARGHKGRVPTVDIKDTRGGEEDTYTDAGGCTSFNCRARTTIAGECTSFKRRARRFSPGIAENHEFQAEVNRLMDIIIINPLYTDMQVLLRELISNSADALEKAHFHSVQDESNLGDAKDVGVKIEHDADQKTLTIIDTGVGMSKADPINNLCTVAKSGTTNFLEAKAEGGDANLIGQFGVGSYSAFLVADKVTVTSKCNDDATQHVWESSADASFTVVDDPRGNTLGRDTRVTLHLKEDAHDYLSEDKLKFIQFPIYVKVEKKEVDTDAEEDEDDDKEDDEKKDDVEAKDVLSCGKKVTCRRHFNMIALTGKAGVQGSEFTSR